MSKLIHRTIISEISWLFYAVCFACKSFLLSQQVFKLMKNLEKARLKLTESELLHIKNRIKNWRTKDQVIDMMRNRYGKLEDQAA